MTIFLGPVCVFVHFGQLGLSPLHPRWEKHRGVKFVFCFLGQKNCEYSEKCKTNPNHTLYYHIIYSGFVDSCQVQNYENNREKYIGKGRGFAFKEAVKQMDQIIADPKVKICFV